MRPPHGTETVRGEGYEIRIVGAPPAGLRDLYHWLLAVPGWVALALIVAAYLFVNVLFALAYLAVGGVQNLPPGSFFDAFFFSVQTMGTIGYGAMYPVSRAAHAVVVAESIAGLLSTAVATGLVFARFSQIRPRVVFSSRLAIGPIDGVPTLMIRVGNARRGRIVDVSFRATLARTTRSAEGVAIYRSVDLPLVRSVAPALARSWMVLHRIDAASPLAGDSPPSLEAAEGELTLSVAGTDENSMQPVHAQHTWLHRSITWGARLADVISETPDGNMLLDLGRFHDLTPTEPVAGFPYRAEVGPERDASS
jgi:inward rectifier potassium channel